MTVLYKRSRVIVCIQNVRILWNICFRFLLWQITYFGWNFCKFIEICKVRYFYISLHSCCRIIYVSLRGNTLYTNILTGLSFTHETERLLFLGLPNIYFERYNWRSISFNAQISRNKKPYYFDIISDYNTMSMIKEQNSGEKAKKTCLYVHIYAYIIFHWSGFSYSLQFQIYIFFQQTNFFINTWV